MNFFEAQRAFWEASAVLSTNACVSMLAFLWVWNNDRDNPVAPYDFPRWMELSGLSRASWFRAKTELIELRFLTPVGASKRGCALQIGPALESQSETLESQSETLESQSETLESQSETLESQSETLESQSETLESQSETLESQSETLESQSETALYRKERRVKESSTVLIPIARLQEELGSIFGRSRNMWTGPELSQLAHVATQWPAVAWEDILTFYRAAATDDRGDARCYRRRSLGALLDHVGEELDRARAWLQTEAGQREKRRVWIEELNALPEDALPPNWRTAGRECFGEENWPEEIDWHQVTPVYREMLLAYIATGKRQAKGECRDIVTNWLMATAA